MADIGKAGLVDLSHVIEDGMTTFKGLPGPHICDFWTREGSAANYDDGSSFQIGRIDMVANTGTYVDSPYHRYEDGADLADLPLGSLADLPGLVVRRPFENGLGTGPDRGRGGPDRCGRHSAARRVRRPDHHARSDRAADGHADVAHRQSARGCHPGG